MSREASKPPVLRQRRPRAKTGSSGPPVRGRIPDVMPPLAVVAAAADAEASEAEAAEAEASEAEDSADSIAASPESTGLPY
jgi:hypothetical protein